MGGGEQRGTCYWPLNGPLKLRLTSLLFILIKPLEGFLC